MMYVQYPALTVEERLAGLSPIPADPTCCAMPVESQDSALVLSAFNLEAIGERLVLRIQLTNGTPMTLDLGSGNLADSWPAAELDALAETFIRNLGADPVIEATWIERDQWTAEETLARVNEVLDRAEAGEADPRLPPPRRPTAS